MPKYVLWFAQTDKDDVPLVGGKAANLGELTRIGLPVPDGFTLTSKAYLDFLEKSRLRGSIQVLLKKIDPSNSELLEETSRLIKKTILQSEIPQETKNEIIENYRKLSDGKNAMVAVRSSATAEDLPESSFAGQQATFLNISGEKALLEAVKSCWASLYEARAIFYREENGFDHFKVSMAVPIQRMVQSEVSGVMFTIDPIKNDKGKVIVEAVWGLGEMIVQGSATPDHYEVSKKDFKLVKKQIAKQERQLIKVGRTNKEIPVSRAFGSKQKLPTDKIIELSKLGRKIENHYGFPQDIEWAYENGKLYIVQSRAVTTIKNVEKNLKENIRIDLPLILTGSPASPGIGMGRAKVLKSPKEISRVKPGDVLVAEMTNPDYVPAMKKAAAIVTDKGGRTSHAAIVSRELGIPCVVGAAKATTKLLHEKTIITVSGSEGKVYKGALAPDRLNALHLATKKQEEAVRLLKTATKVFVNLGEKELARDVAEKYVDGVGLLRAEFMMAEIGIHPRKIISERKQKFFINKLAEDLKVFAEAFNPRPIIYRATDFKSNEYRNLKGGAKYEDQESNPMLGFRGASRYLADPEVFQMELEAIKLVRNKMELKNLWLMIPFVRTVKEMEQIKKIVTGSGLHRSGTFKLLMMAEIPSNIILIDKFLDLGIDGISIGSNDLTMLTLGIDRDNSKVAGEFNELDESVMWGMEKLIKEARKRKLYAGICGQAPSVYPELTEKLVEWGISSISVSPDAIEKTRQVVYEAERKIVNKSKT